MDDLTDFYRRYSSLIESAYQYEIKRNYDFALDRYEDAIKLCKMCNMDSREAEKKYNKCLQMMDKYNNREM